MLDAEAITSLGESAAETALLLRAGVGNVQPSDFIDAQGQRVLLCATPALPPDLPGPDRLVALAAHALGALHRRMAVAAHEDRAPLIALCLPQRLGEGGDAAGRPALNGAGQAFVDALRERLPAAWSAARIEAFPIGRAAGAPAMLLASQFVGGAGPVLWGGVDSCLDWNVLGALERAGRLMTNDNVDAVRPGEAAAFVALARPGSGQAAVLALGAGREPQPVGADGPCVSEGMSQALDTALAPLRAAGRRCRFWALDATHEAYATHEVQNLIARFGDALGADSELAMPLKELGDAGAAAMPLLAVLALQAWRQGLARDDCAVVTGSSDSGLRGAMLLASRIASPVPSENAPLPESGQEVSS
jgi:hypothetical protein